MMKEIAATTRPQFTHTPIGPPEGEFGPFWAEISTGQEKEQGFPANRPVLYGYPSNPPVNPPTSGVFGGQLSFWRRYWRQTAFLPLSLKRPFARAAQPPSQAY